MNKVLYSELLISGKLNDYLADLNEQAEEMFSRLVKQLAEAAAKRRKQDEKTNFEHYTHPVYGAEHRPCGGFCGGRGQHKHRQSH